VTRSIAAFGHHVSLDLSCAEGAVRARWDGRADTDTAPQVVLAVGDGSGERNVPLDARTGHAFDVPRQTRAFVEAVLRSGDPPADGHAGRAAVALCLAAERSLRAGSVPIEGPFAGPVAGRAQGPAGGGGEIARGPGAG
jgi:myo-inositol 2-dehydrogenase/D-chiro-inositol 1-dehydrogenase